MPLIKLPASRRLTEAYQISATILLTLDRLGLIEGDRVLSFRRVVLHNERYLVAEIDTRALSMDLVKALRRYRLTVQLRETVQRPVVAIHRQDWIEFAVDLGAPPPVILWWQRLAARALPLNLLGAPQPGAISHLEA
jgi:hypothetical protein